MQLMPSCFSLRVRLLPLRAIIIFTAVCTNTGPPEEVGSVVRAHGCSERARSGMSIISACSVRSQWLVLWYSAPFENSCLRDYVLWYVTYYTGAVLQLYCRSTVSGACILIEFSCYCEDFKQGKQSSTACLLIVLYHFHHKFYINVLALKILFSTNLKVTSSCTVPQNKWITIIHAKMCFIVFTCSQTLIHTQ